MIEELNEIKCSTCGAEVLTYRDYVSDYDRKYVTRGETSFSFYCHSCRNLTVVKVDHWDINHYRVISMPEEEREKRFICTRGPERPVKTNDLPRWLDFGYQKRMREWRKLNDAYHEEVGNEIRQESRELESYIENGLQDTLKKIYPPVKVTPCECCLGSGIHVKENKSDQDSKSI
jgi:hypothetical protein